MPIYINKKLSSLLHYFFPPFFLRIMNDIFKNIIAQKNLLLELSKHKSHYKTAILKKAQPQLILAICESIYNILEGKVPLNLIQKQELKKYKAILRKLVQKNKIKYKKKLLVQSGGFLPVILPAIFSLISNLFD